jgi:hypothetical protein
VAHLTRSPRPRPLLPGVCERGSRERAGSPVVAAQLGDTPWPGVALRKSGRRWPRRRCSPRHRQKAPAESRASRRLTTCALRDAGAPESSGPSLAMLWAEGRRLRDRTTRGGQHGCRLLELLSLLCVQRQHQPARDAATARWRRAGRARRRPDPVVRQGASRHREDAPLIARMAATRQHASAATP